MNPNVRKRHDLLPREDRCPDTRKPMPDVAPATGKLFTRSGKKPAQVVKHEDFKVYTTDNGRLRIPNERFYPPRLCMPDGYTIAITRTAASRLIREFRMGKLGTVGRIKAKAKARSRKAKAPKAPKPFKPSGEISDHKLASRIWESWMRTAQKRTFAEYVEAWMKENTA